MQDMFTKLYKKITSLLERASTRTEETSLLDVCANLVTLKRCEAFPLLLLGSKQPGEWIPVSQFCQQFRLDGGESNRGLYATWLPDPSAHAGYAVVLFYDDESKWSMAAHYNRARLFGDSGAVKISDTPGVVIIADASRSSQAAAAE